ncbi:MAG: MarR family transcriptional regulator [Acidobacteriia bacterium]|nr:MarR family transcriptional regulator [Terriglobia bacterium]
MPAPTPRRKGREQFPGPLGEELYLQLQRSAEALRQRLEAALKPAGLSPTQYNVLRILRGAGPGGLPCRRIAERMVTRDPDITRLLDRLEARGWVARTREKKDRRVITTRITEAGLRRLKTLDEPVAGMHRQQVGQVPERTLRALIGLLKQVRSPR